MFPKFKTITGIATAIINHNTLHHSNKDWLTLWEMKSVSEVALEKLWMHE